MSFFSLDLLKKLFSTEYIKSIEEPSALEKEAEDLTDLAFSPNKWLEDLRHLAQQAIEQDHPTLLTIGESYLRDYINYSNWVFITSINLKSPMVIAESRIIFSIGFSFLIFSKGKNLDSYVAIPEDMPFIHLSSSLEELIIKFDLRRTDIEQQIQKVYALKEDLA